MAGKNKIERSVRFLIDNGAGVEQDISVDLVPGTLQGGGMTLDQVDMTGVSDAVKKALGGYGDANVSGRFFMNDTATTGAFTVLRGREGSSGTLTIKFGQSGAAPTTGDWKWSGEYTIMQANVVQDGGRILLDCLFTPQSGQPDPTWTQL